VKSLSIINTGATVSTLQRLSILLLAGISTNAFAQETVDVGILKNKDISVVQKQLYNKKDKSEITLHAGLMPFDPYSITPKFELSYAKFTSETFGWEVSLGGGYGLKNSAFRELEGPAYAITPDVYRYLGSVIADVQWSPIYAKMAYDGKKIFHYDVYGLAGGGLTVEESFMPDTDFSYGPTMSIGLGSRIFLSSGSILRIQLRDDFVLQSRAKTAETQGLYLKQNMTLSIGYTIFDLGKERGSK
jgi:outer membrane beta-barrel protein